MTHLIEGDKAPFFSTVSHNSEEISLDSFKGKKIILYFYPKDNTPGCTAEACNLRDNYAWLTAHNFIVIGVSPDSDASHNKFSAKHDLPFYLIADVDKEILKAYGAWGLKKLYGKEYEGVIRTTFIINEDGFIQNIIKKVKTKEHTQQIIDLLNIED